MPYATRPGFSLLEAITVLLIAGAILAVAAPSTRAALDGFAVRSARDELAAAVARTRSVAIAAGGANLIVHTNTPGYSIERRDGAVVTAFQDLAASYGVRVAADGTANERVVVTFDGLGIGRLANRTFRIRRGNAEARITLSAYGRVRRW